MHRNNFLPRPLIGLCSLVLLLVVACVPQPDRQSVAPGSSDLNEETATYLAAMPLACLDRPHAAPQGTGYLYERTASLRVDYESTRAFYGCYDWHSAVNSTWTLVEILVRFPESRIAPLIAEKLNQHLTIDTLAGELAYFAENPRFERPYGWAWLMALEAALRRSTHPAARGWTESVTPLAEQFATDFLPYVENLDYPLRVGTHNNTAFALDLALGYAEEAGNVPLAGHIRDNALRLYGEDTACALAFEPSGSDFLSPCLEVAKLMSAVLDTDFGAWLDEYLGQVDDDAFAALAEPIRLRSDNDALDTGQLGAKSHLIGLAFTRAEALERMAAALPVTDPRVQAMREIASTQADQGFAAMFEADYLGSHWLATFALKYLLAKTAGAATG